MISAMVKHEFRVRSCELPFTSYDLKAWKHELNSKVRVEIHKLPVQSDKIKFTRCEFNFTSHESNPLVTSLDPRVTSLNLGVTSSNPLVQELWNQWELK